MCIYHEYFKAIKIFKIFVNMGIQVDPLPLALSAIFLEILDLTKKIVDLYAWFFKNCWYHPSKFIDTKNTTFFYKSCFSLPISMLKLILVQPSTNASSERYFSNVQRIKSYLRSRTRTYQTTY